MKIYYFTVETHPFKLAITVTLFFENNFLDVKKSYEYLYLTHVYLVGWRKYLNRAKIGFLINNNLMGLTKLSKWSRVVSFWCLIFRGAIFLFSLQIRHRTKRFAAHLLSAARPSLPTPNAGYYLILHVQYELSVYPGKLLEIKTSGNFFRQYVSNQY